MNYQLQRQGQTFGPYTLDDLRRYLASGNVQADDLVQSEEMTDWLPVAQVLGPMALPTLPPSQLYSSQAYPSQADTYAEPQIERFQYFPVSVFKFMILSLVTLGIYEVYWAYKQWVRIKADTGESMLPWARAIFCGIWNFSLFSRVHDSAATQEVSADWNSILLGALVLFFGVTSRLPIPWGQIVLLSFLPYLPVVATIEKINRRQAHLVAESLNTRFTGINIVILILGGIFLMLDLLGTLATMLKR